MRALIQRVVQASVTVDGEVCGAISQGLLVFLGIEKYDNQVQADKMLHKLFHYRVFSDPGGKMNLSVRDIQGGLLLVSQFTLVADTTKGLRPSFSSAAEPQQAHDLYDYVLEQARIMGKENNNIIEAGIFGGDMKVALTNDGPVTFVLEVN